MTTTEAHVDVNFAPRRFAHVNMWVGDLNESMKFYNEVCGVGAQATEPDLRAGFLTNGNTHHDMGLIEVTGGNERLGRDGQVQVTADMGLNPGLFHLGWEMENEADLVAAIERAKRADIAFDSTVDHLVTRSIYLPDPDGNMLEFYADVMKDWQGWFKGDLELITGVWNPGDPEPTTDPRYDPDAPITTVKDAPVHPLRITHAALATNDLGRLRAFYEDVGGLETSFVSRDGKLACLNGTATSLGLSGCDLAICEVAADQPTGMHHFGFELENEKAVDAAVDALAGAGRAPKISIDNEMKKSFFILSPDDAWVEFGVDRSNGFSALDAEQDPTSRPFLV